MIDLIIMGVNMRRLKSQSAKDSVVYARKTLAIESLFTNSENFRFTQAYIDGSISSDQAIAEMKKYILNKKLAGD